MNELSPRGAFHGLPLTAEQNRQVESYIHRQQQAGKEWDTPELRAMVADMLNPPETVDEISDDIARSTEAERWTGTHEEPGQLS